MKSESDLSDVVTLASSTHGRQFKFGRWLRILHERSLTGGKSSVFDDLAFTAKSFQKVFKLVSADSTISVDKSRAATELKFQLEKFSAELEKIVAQLPDDLREEFTKEFLTPSGGSFEKMRNLISDFSLLKDYLLEVRDSKHSNR